jgi:hypothetical protein
VRRTFSAFSTNPLLQFKSLFFVGRCDLCVPTGLLNYKLAPVACRVLVGNFSSGSTVTSKLLQSCPIRAIDDSSAIKAVEWAATSPSRPCSISTTAGTSPTLLARFVNAGDITVSAQRVAFSRKSSPNFVVTLTYRCLRSSTHHSSRRASTMPALATTYTWSDDLIKKAPQRQSVECNCPFYLRLRFYLPSLDEASEVAGDCSPHALSTAHAVLEAPFGLSNHGGTHSPQHEVVMEHPCKDGVAPDYRFHPKHIFIVRLLCALHKLHVDSNLATSIAQRYMTWLRPKLMANPCTLTAALPSRVLGYWSTPPPTYIKLNEEARNIFADLPDVDGDCIPPTDEVGAAAGLAELSCAVTVEDESDDGTRSEDHCGEDEPGDESGSDSVSECSSSESSDEAGIDSTVDDENGSDTDTSSESAGSHEGADTNASVRLRQRNAEIASKTFTESGACVLRRGSPLRCVLRMLNQLHNASCHGWTLDERETSSLFQLLASAERRGATLWQHFLCQVVPSFVAEGWGSFSV